MPKHKLLLCLLTLVAGLNGYSQGKHRVSLLLDFHANSTVYDRTRRNNAGGAGVRLDAAWNTNRSFHPMISINGDVFGGTKDLQLTASGEPVATKSGVAGLYAGACYNARQHLYLACCAGVNSYNDQLHFGLRPELGLFADKNRRWKLGVSLTHIFEHNPMGDQPFGYLSFSGGIRIF